MRYVALLRGINVGGHKIIPMAKLKAVVESCGWTNVRTYIQSGNVLFDTPSADAGAVRRTVETALSASLGYEIPTLIRSKAEWKNVVTRNIFAAEHARGKTKMYVVFAEKKPSPKERDELLGMQVKGMSFHLAGCELYCLLDAKFGGNNSPFSVVKIEKVLGQKTTARNWATVNALLDLANED